MEEYRNLLPKGENKLQPQGSHIHSLDHTFGFLQKKAVLRQ